MRHQIPRSWVARELAGLAADQQAVEHWTFEDLAEYCFGALAPVGLMMLRVLGVRGGSVELNAARFAVAMQLSDMLTDIAEDAEDGRCYLPADELEDLGVVLEEVRRGGPSRPWRAFMQRMLQRNRELFAHAEVGLEDLPLLGALTAAIVGSLHKSQLEDIEAAGYDVFGQPPHFRLRHLGAAMRAAMRLMGARVRGLPFRRSRRRVRLGRSAQR